MRIVIIGAGKVGYALARQLSGEGHDLTMVDKKGPALQNAEFVRYGVMHKNTFINGPTSLNKYYALKGYENIYFAGCGYIFGENEIKVVFTDSEGNIVKEHTI